MFSIEMVRTVTAEREREIERLARVRRLAPPRRSGRFRMLPKNGREAA